MKHRQADCPNLNARPARTPAAAPAVTSAAAPTAGAATATGGANAGCFVSKRETIWFLDCYNGSVLYRLDLRRTSLGSQLPIRRRYSPCWRRSSIRCCSWSWHYLPQLRWSKSVRTNFYTKICLMKKDRLVHVSLPTRTALLVTARPALLHPAVLDVELLAQRRAIVARCP